MDCEYPWCPRCGCADEDVEICECDVCGDVFCDACSVEQPARICPNCGSCATGRSVAADRLLSGAVHGYDEDLDDADFREDEDQEDDDDGDAAREGDLDEAEVRGW